MAVRGIGLISGGLDSMLAVLVLKDQGIDVTGISFTTPFFSSAMAETAARRIGFPLIIMDITVPHLEVVKNPLSGYGANMNPCIDCHALMIREAGRVMAREGMDFVFTGEVLNERPMSQNGRSLNRVVNLAGLRGYVLRPLSARLLKETIPEAEGKVDRSRLLDIQGRSRKRQFALAEKYGLREYPSPAGGCLLTDPTFSRRLRDLFDNGPEASAARIEILKVGRHFRLRTGVKAIVGRNEEENGRLISLKTKSDAVFHTEGVPGPTVILSGAPSPADVLTAAGLCARYSDAKTGTVTVTGVREGENTTIVVHPLEDSMVSALRL